MIQPSYYLYPAHIHPLLYGTFMFIIGICWQSAQLSWHIPLLLLLSLFFVVYFFDQHAHKTVWLYGTVASVFLFLGAFRSYQQHQQFLSFYQHIENSTYDIQATVLELQQLDHHAYHQLVCLALKQIKKDQSKENWKKISGTIKLYLERPMLVEPHDTILISPLTFRQQINGSFSHYLIKEGISATLFPEKVVYTIIDRPSWSTARWIYRIRTGVITSCKKRFSPSVFALFSTIFLGNNDVDKAYLQQYQHTFTLWGITHHLARSGLHLIIFIMLINLLLSFIPLRYELKQGCILFIVMMYAALSWTSTSFMRAVHAFILYKVGTIFMISIDFLHIVTLVTFFTLFINPMQLFFLDFQLSFGLTFALAWLNHIHAQYHAHHRTIEG